MVLGISESVILFGPIESPFEELSEWCFEFYNI